MQVEFDVVGSAYANALVELAQDNNNLEGVHADVDGLQALLKDSSDVQVHLWRLFWKIAQARDLARRCG